MAFLPSRRNKMKSRLALIAAIIAAFMIIAPFVASEQGAEETDMLLLTSVDDNSDITGDITEDITITSGSSRTITGEVNLSEYVTITVEEGAALCINPMLNLTVNGSEYSGFLFEKGSYISVLDRTIKVPSELEVEIDGQFSYTFGLVIGEEILANCSIGIADGTVLTTNGYATNFNGGVTIDVDAKVVLGGDLSDIITKILSGDFSDLSLSAEGTVDMDLGEISTRINGNDFKVSGYFEAEFKESTESDTGKINLSFSGSDSYKISSGDSDMTVSSISDLILTIAFTDDGIESSVNGKLSIDLGSDSYTVGSEFTLSGLVAEYNLEFDDTTIEIDELVKFKEMSVNTNDGNTTVELNLKGVSAAAGYSMDYKGLVEAIKNIRFGEIMDDADEIDAVDVSEYLAILNADDQLRQRIELAIENANLPDSIWESEAAAYCASILSYMSDESNYRPILENLADIYVEAGESIEVSDFSLRVINDYLYLNVNGSDLDIDAKFTYDGSVVAGMDVELDNLQVIVDNDTFVMVHIDDLDYECGFSDSVMDASLEASYVEVITERAWVFCEDVYVSAAVDNTGANIQARGDYHIDIFSDSQLSVSIQADDLDATGKVTYDKETGFTPEFESATCKFSYVTNGILMDFGKITVDDKFAIKADKLKYSGYPTHSMAHNKKVTGEFTDVFIPSPIFFGGECTYSTANMEYELYSGATATCKVSFDGDMATVTITVKGEFPYDALTDEYLPFTGMAIDAIVQPPIYSVKGDGVFYKDTYDASEYAEMNGTIYTYYSVVTPELEVMLDFTNVLLGIEDGDVDKMTVKACEGYTLNPDSFVGFDIIDGYVVLDPVQVATGEVEIAASADPNHYTLTVDGKKIDAVFDDFVSIDVSKDTVWLKDSEGTIYGFIYDGEWNYLYKTVGDLTLTSYKGTHINVKDGQTEKTSSDTVYFELPDDFMYISVSTPDGMVYHIVGDYYPVDRVTLSSTATKYKGNDAYEIESNIDMLAMFPVKDVYQTVFHVVNGEAQPMSGDYELIGDQLYLVVTLKSYSLYYVDDNSGSSSDNNMLYIFTAVMIILIVLVVAGYLHVKSKKSA